MKSCDFIESCIICFTSKPLGENNKETRERIIAT